MLAIAIISLVILAAIAVAGLVFSVLMFLDDVCLPAFILGACFLSLSLPIIFISMAISKYL